MFKKHKWTLLFGSAIILLPILAGLLLWDRLPEQIPTHWGVNGEPDGWSSKAAAVFALPAVLLVVHWVCILVTHMDPRNGNQGKKIMGLMLWICPVLSVLLGSLSLGSAVGWAPNINMILPLFMGILFVAIGNYLPKCAWSYTVGIRIPWTLDSEENWNATHRFAGKIWVGGGLLMLVCAFLPEIWSVIAMVGIMLVITIVPMIYSWRFYRKEKENQ